MQHYLFLFLCGLLGVIASNTRKFISVRRKAKKTIDYKMNLKTYLQMDGDLMVYQVLVLIIGLIVWKYAAGKSWYQYSEGIFIGWGLLGAELFNTFSSAAESYVLNKIKNFIPGASVVSTYWIIQNSATKEWILIYNGTTQISYTNDVDQALLFTNSEYEAAMEFLSYFFPNLFVGHRPRKP